MNWISVGKIMHAHGIRGELYLHVFSGDWFWIPRLKVVQKDGHQVFQKFLLKRTLAPNSEKLFSFLDSRPHKKGLLIKALEIGDRTQAELWRGFEFCIPEELLNSKKGEPLTLREILSFLVYDQDVLLGPICGFSSNGPQDLLIVDRNHKKVEIPFVEPFLKSIDWENKKIFMTLPKGLYEE